MRIFRVERNGYGPYVFNDSLWLLDSHCSRRRPEPKEDGIAGFIAGTHLSGFSSLKQAFSWFRVPECRKLNEMGYVLTEYEAPRDRVLEGGMQVAFHQDFSNLIATHNIWELLRIHESSRRKHERRRA